MKYSIIIPVYNAENTIKKCLDSILQQRYEDCEILLINDGSTDNSGDICEMYANKYPCIRYEHKINGGVSSARNLGLEIAAGEYLLFVDSDDMVNIGYFEAIDRALSDSKVDILQFGYRAFGGAQFEIVPQYHMSTDKYSIAMIVSEAMRSSILNSLWTKAIKKSVVDEYNIRFSQGLQISEDLVFIFQCAVHANAYCSIGEVLYSVNVGNKESLSRKKREYLTDQIFLANAMLEEILIAAELPPKAKTVYEKSLSRMFYRGPYSSSNELFKFDMSSRERKKEIRAICKKFASKRIRPRGIKCWIMAIPVHLRMSSFIGFMLKTFNQ